MLTLQHRHPLSLEMLVSELLEQCKACGEGTMRPSISLEPVDYRGVYSYAPLYYSRCSICRIDIAEPTQIEINNIWMRDFRGKVDRMLS